MYARELRTASRAPLAAPPALGRRRGVRDGDLETHLGLPHAHTRARYGKPLDESVGDRGRERFDEIERAAVRDLADARDDFPIVDRVREVVAARARVVRGKLNVEEELLAGAPLRLGGPVPAAELQRLDLDQDLAQEAAGIPFAGRRSRPWKPSSARAAASASTFSRTSWTRKSEAPRS